MIRVLEGSITLRPGFEFEFSPPLGFLQGLVNFKSGFEIGVFPDSEFIISWDKTQNPIFPVLPEFCGRAKLTASSWGF